MKRMVNPHKLFWPHTHEWLRIGFRYPLQHRYLRLGLSVSDRKLIRKPIAHLDINTNAWRVAYDKS
jgi:hypothetical protein